MNRRTNIISFDENLIKCIKNCLSNVSSFSNLARNLSDNEIRREIKKENEEAENQKVTKKNSFEIIINSIITLLGDDKFKIEKTVTPNGCPFCNKQSCPFYLKYITINLDDFLGSEFSLEEFCCPVRGGTKCRNCHKNINVEYNFTFFPEILVIILGSKSLDKVLNYKYKTEINYSRKNNENVNSIYTLKSLIGQIEELKFKSFLFNNERDFKNSYVQNKDIFSNPAVLFYEGPKMSFNDNEEYLQSDYLENMMEQEDDNNSIITIYFNFVKNKKQIYLDINKNEKFSKAITQLKEKYNWLKQMRYLKFYFNNKEVDNNKSLVENGIIDNSEIIIN